jgi:exosortase
MTHDYASYIPLVAPAGASLIYWNRRKVFSKVQLNYFIGSGLFLAAAMLTWTKHLYLRSSDNSLSVETLALISLWMSGFIFCYGTHAFRAARFPLLFLLLLVPIPDFLMERIISFLQTGSAASAYTLLRILDVRVFKEGFVLRFPTIDIEVAKECSGIRSSLALLITTLAVGQFVLRSAWSKSLLVLSVVPIVILKNSVRIVTISLLTVYVDRGFLHSWLHTSGGIVFYLLGLLSLVPIAILLRKWERTNSGEPESRPEEPIGRQTTDLMRDTVGVRE